MCLTLISEFLLVDDSLIIIALDGDSGLCGQTLGCGLLKVGLGRIVNTTYHIVVRFGIAAYHLEYLLNRVDRYSGALYGLGSFPL